MSLDFKAEENRNVAKKCRAMGAYSAGATRAYYSAFQKAKYYLEINGFDYATFLTRIKAAPFEKDFSHGTIKRALVECMMSRGKDPKEVYKLVIWDNLYKKRIKADYDGRLISDIELDSCLDELNTVLSVIN